MGKMSAFNPHKRVRHDKPPLPDWAATLPRSHRRELAATGRFKVFVKVVVHPPTGSKAATAQVFSYKRQIVNTTMEVTPDLLKAMDNEREAYFEAEVDLKGTVNIMHRLSNQGW